MTPVLFSLVGTESKATFLQPVVILSIIIHKSDQPAGSGARAGKLLINDSFTMI